MKYQKKLLISFPVSMIDEMDAQCEALHYPSRAEFLREAVRQVLRTLKEKECVNANADINSMPSTMASDSTARRVAVAQDSSV